MSGSAIKKPKSLTKLIFLEHKDPIAYSGSLYCPGKEFLATNTNRELVDREGWNKLVIRAEGDPRCDSY